jgi:hypothetical protein
MATDVTRHRDKNGEIGHKHGNTLIRTLRKSYGEHFAEGCRDDERAKRRAAQDGRAVAE